MDGRLINSTYSDLNILPLLLNKPNLNQNTVLILESSDEKNSMFADKPAVTKFNTGREIFTMFEKLAHARADFQLVSDVKKLKNSCMLINSKVTFDSLNSTNNNLSKFLQEDQRNEGVMEVDTEPLPGKGKKFIFKAKINDSEVNVIVDTGSSTTLVRKSLVIDLNLRHYTSRLPVNFLGMFVLAYTI